eukprot:350820-Chlamydomonas_euryale.AAC.4
MRAGVAAAEGVPPQALFSVGVFRGLLTREQAEVEERALSRSQTLAWAKDLAAEVEALQLRKRPCS